MLKWFFIGLIIFSSIVVNAYQGYQIYQFKNLQNDLSQKNKIVDERFDEIVLSYLEKIKSSQDNILKDQGRLEGILAVVNNFNPDENIHSALWHDGYNSGESVNDVNAQLSYEEGYHKALEDMYCPTTKKSYGHNDYLLEESFYVEKENN